MRFTFVRSGLAVAALAGAIALAEPAFPRATPAIDAVGAPATPLAPTVHPPVARNAAMLWLVPTTAGRWENAAT